VGVRKKAARLAKLTSLLDQLALLGLPTPTRMVALAIQNLCTTNGGTTEATTERIGWYAGIAWRQTVRHLRTLEDHGIIVVERLPGGRMRIKLGEPEIDEDATGRKTQRRTTGEATDRTSIERDALMLIETYQDLWKKRYDSHCFVSGRDRSKAVEIVRKIGVEDASVRVKRYIEDDDRWLLDRGHSFAIFVAKLNQYVGRRNGEAEISRHEDFDGEVRKSAERSRRRKAKRDAMAKRDRS
jgi:DNA-binding transcriptional ArsR family regulator